MDPIATYDIVVNSTRPIIDAIGLDLEMVDTIHDDCPSRGIYNMI